MVLFLNDNREPTMATVKQGVFGRIRAGKKGLAYSAKDFLDLGNRGAVDVALSQLATEGAIRRVMRGIYDQPEQSELLKGPCSPDAHQVAKATARKHGWRIVPSGAQAANLLGLSTQVPAKVLYLSDGPTRTCSAGKLVIRFQHAEPKTLGTASEVNGMVIQALRYLGKGAIDQRTLHHLIRTLDAKDKTRLLQDTQYCTDWIHDVAKRIVREQEQIHG
jgi:hypothetical protein